MATLTMMTPLKVITPVAIMTPLTTMTPVAAVMILIHVAGYAGGRKAHGQSKLEVLLLLREEASLLNPGEDQNVVRFRFPIRKIVR